MMFFKVLNPQIVMCATGVEEALKLYHKESQAPKHSALTLAVSPDLYYSTLGLGISDPELLQNITVVVVPLPVDSWMLIGRWGIVVGCYQ